MALRSRRLSGTYFDVGRQLGERMKSFVRPGYGSHELQFADACAREVERFYPEALEKLGGIIAGGGLDPEQFRCHFLAKGAPVRACVGIVVEPVRSAEAGPLLGRNYHWPLADRVWCELRRTEVTGELPHVGYTHHWGGLPDVLNAAGLYVALFSLPQLPPRRPGLQWHVITDYLANRCTSADEAAEFLSAVPHLRSFTYLAADAEGRSVAVEATPAGAVVRRATEGFLVVTNHQVAGEARTTGRERSRGLYQALCRRLATKPQWDWEGVRGLIADHELGVCVGDHERPSDAWGTLFAVMVRPSAHEFSVAPGFPCREPFVAVTVPRGVRQS